MNTENSAVKKIAPMSLMLMFIMFIGGLVSSMRDAFMVKVANCGGAETTNVLKLVAAPIASILLMSIFIKLTRKFSATKVLTMVVLFFVGFFLLFGTVLFPMRHVLQADEATIRHWQAAFPHSHWIVACAGNWLLSLFYVIGGLWTVAALPLTFWHIANTYTTRAEAKKYFGVLNLLGPAGMLSAGGFSYYLGQKWGKTPNGYDICVRWQAIAIAVAGCILILICHVLFRTVIKDFAPMGARAKDKEKMSVLSSLKYVLTDKKALYIAIFAASYYMVINPLEAAWKDQIKVSSSTAAEFSAINGKALIYISLTIIVLSLVMMVTLGHFKWKTTALITPVLVGLFGLLFLFVSELANVWGNCWVFHGKALASWAVILGTIMVCLSKGCKKSVFDTSKNMAYRILEPENRLAARLATETCGSRLGEVIGNLIPLALTNWIFPGASIISVRVLPIIIGFTIVGMIMWLSVIARIQPCTKE